MQQKGLHLSSLTRIRIWYALILLILGVITVRLFYIQVIRHNYYQTSALLGQLKEYEIPAARGVIEAHSGDKILPIVLNEFKYTLFADPKFITDRNQAAVAVQKVIGGNAGDYVEAMKADSRYVILAKKLDKDQKKSLEDLNIKGLGLREVPYRTYPQGSLAAQLLGFVNDEGEGKYGVEQALDSSLKGVPGQLKAITDASGVPLASNKDNILLEPRSGQRLLLTVDIGLQQRLEEILKAGLETAKSESGGAIIMEVNTGKVRAMANFPTYNPSEFYKIENGEVFNNAIVSAPLEVGSIMKPLTVAAALDQGVISKDTTYHDPGFFKIGDATVNNIEEAGGAGTKSISDILRQSLNTGATWVLMQMGGGEINEKARKAWHGYMTEHYHFGSATGIEQGFEAAGSVPDPVEGFGLNIQYANTAFGQGMTATPLQMAAALSSVANGGTYYRPQLVEKTISGSVETVKQPEVLNPNVVSDSAAKSVRELMEFAFSKNHRTYGMAQLPAQYSIAGKTGTAQVPKPEGGYYDDRYNGTFMGYVGGNLPQYVIVVRVNEPKIAGYAGSKGAGPIFTALATMLIDGYGVTPRN